MVTCKLKLWWFFRVWHNFCIRLQLTWPLFNVGSAFYWLFSPNYLFLFKVIFKFLIYIDIPLESVSKFGFLLFTVWSSLKLCYNCLKLWYLSKYLHWYTFGICFKLSFPWLFCFVFIKAWWAAWVTTLHPSLVICHFQS